MRDSADYEKMVRELLKPVGAYRLFRTSVFPEAVEYMASAATAFGCEIDTVMLQNVQMWETFLKPIPADVASFVVELVPRLLGLRRLICDGRCVCLLCAPRVGVHEQCTARGRFNAP